MEKNYQPQLVIAGFLPSTVAFGVLGGDTLTNFIEKKLWLLRGYRGWTTTQLYGDYFITRWWQLKYLLFSPRTLGKISNLTNIFQMGWNHQPDKPLLLDPQ